MKIIFWKCLLIKSLLLMCTLINSMEIKYLSKSKFPTNCAFLQLKRFNEKITEIFTKLVEHLVNRDQGSNISLFLCMNIIVSKRSSV